MASFTKCDAWLIVTILANRYALPEFARDDAGRLSMPWSANGSL